MIKYEINKEDRVNLSVNGSLAEIIVNSVMFVKSVYKAVSENGADKISGNVFKSLFLEALLDSFEDGLFDENDKGFAENINKKDDILKSDFDLNEEFLKFFRGGDDNG